MNTKCSVRCLAYSKRLLNDNRYYGKYIYNCNRCLVIITVNGTYKRMNRCERTVTKCSADDSALKRKETGPHAATRTDTENTMLKLAGTTGHVWCGSTHVRCPEPDKFRDTKDSSGPRGLSGGRVGSHCPTRTVAVGDDGLWSGDGCTMVCVFTHTPKNGKF